MSCYLFYYDEPILLVVMFLLFIIWGVLNVILFFKLWRACDNIDKMANNKPTTWDALYLAGKKEEAYAVAVANMVAELNAIFERQREERDLSSGIIITKTLDFDASAYRQTITKWESRIAKIGIGSLPDELRSGEAFIAWRLTI